jgi:polysaccharide pyruvyl transferase CsaB
MGEITKMQVVLCGYYGFGNGGDEALLAALLQMLPPQVSPLVLSGNPEATQRLHGVAACDRNHFPSVWQALRASQGFIWGGGSLIQDATSTLSPFYYIGWMSIAQRLGLKTVAWGQGIGPLQRRTSQWLAQKSFRGCTAVSVRDAASAQVIQQWGIQAVQAPDPVWALEAVAFPELKNLPAPRVAVILRSHPQLTPDRLAVLAESLRQFQQASQTFMLLLPFQASQDLAIAQTLHASLPGISQILQISDPRQLKGVFRQVEMAIAMRLHGLIMAAAEGCCCFALSYDPKVSQLAQDLDLASWEISELPSDPPTISHTWLDCLAQGRQLSPAKIQSLVDSAQRHQELLENVFALPTQPKS